MKHLGDISCISGYDAPVVDCIIGGSPCQDLSVAGKRTYEQMFYHIPKRRSQTVQVERERDKAHPSRVDPRIPGSVEPLVPEGTQAECCSSARDQSKGFRQRTRTPCGVSSSRFEQGTIKGFPLCNKRLQWCQQLKLTATFYPARHDGRKEISWNTWASPPMNRLGSGS